MYNVSNDQINILVIADQREAANRLCVVFDTDQDLVLTEDIKVVDNSYPLQIESRPDLFIVRIANVPIDGFRWIESLRSEFTNVPIILISGGEEISCTEKALRLGANGYISLESELTSILLATRCVLDGNRYTSNQYSQWLIRRVAVGKSTSIRHLLGDLSKQERRVFECIGEGQSNRSIAECIGIHAKTVATYRSRIKAKLGIDDGQILAEIATEWKQVEETKA
jgi:DNA-binding NarL/FixJ family response regulator